MSCPAGADSLDDSGLRAAGSILSVVGLGIMGSAIAANLVRSGFAVVGYDPDPAARDLLNEVGGQTRDSAAEAMDRAGVVFTCLPSATALESTIDALVQRPKSRPDLVVAELSTLSLADKAATQGRLGAAGIIMLDCPLSGTGAQALTKDLSVYASGDRDAYDRIVPFIRGFAERPHWVGEFGKGSQMKFVANLLVAIHNVATAEAMALAQKAGLNLDQVVEVLRAGAGNSRIFELRAPMMADDVYVPATMKLGIWEKDMALISDFIALSGAATPLFNATIPIYERASRASPNEDTAAVFQVLR